MAKEKTLDLDTKNIEEKKLLLDQARAQIEKEFGKGSLMKLGESPNQDIEVIPTGNILLDEALGVGGYPKGRIIEIYGPESSGKTTLALQAVAQAQKQGGIAAYIDAEHALDPVYAKKLGVDINELWISQPDSGEQALELAENLIKTTAIDIMVIDSVAALTPIAEIEGDMTDMQVGAQARLMSKALRKITSLLSKTSTTLIFINQIRMKIGVMFGNPETTTGGNALKFYSTIRIDIRKGDNITKSSDQIIGNKVKIKIVKNKVAPPFKKVEADLYYGEGLSAEAALVDVASRLQILEKSGSWYSYKGEKISQGKDNMIAYLKANYPIQAEIDEACRKIIFAPKQ